MKFKPFALVVIGVLLGSTITLALTRPSVSTAEILACTNKKSGKTRLTTSGACRPTDEQESAVDDLWALQPTVPRTGQPTTTSAKTSTKHVVDSTGKDLGLLVAVDGIDTYWTRTDSGVFGLGISERRFQAQFGHVEIYSDANCTLPLIPFRASTDSDFRRVVTDDFFRKPRRVRGFRVVGEPISNPRVVFQRVIESGCTPYTKSDYQSWESIVDVSKFYRTEPVELPTYSPPLKIVER